MIWERGLYAAFACLYFVGTSTCIYSKGTYYKGGKEGSLDEERGVARYGGGMFCCSISSCLRNLWSRCKEALFISGLRSGVVKLFFYIHVPDTPHWRNGRVLYVVESWVEMVKYRLYCLS